MEELDVFPCMRHLFWGRGIHPNKYCSEKLQTHRKIVKNFTLPLVQYIVHIHSELFQRLNKKPISRPQ